MLSILLCGKSMTIRDIIQKDKNEIKQKMRSIRFEQLKYEDVWKISTISNHFLIRRNKKYKKKHTKKGISKTNIQTLTSFC